VTRTAPNGTWYASGMTTSKTGLVHGTTIELDSAVPEMEGKRVRVVLEVVDEPRLSAQQQRELWQTWAERGSQGPIEDGPDTDVP
jgi:hypothetical protein